MPAAIYLPDGPGRFTATELARGPWDPEAQHGGAPAALLARAFEQVAGEQPMAIARITYELLRPVPLAGPLEVAAQVVRPGRRVQLLDATLTAGDQEVVRARALRIRTEQVAVPAPSAAAAPPCDPAGSVALGPDTLDGRTMLARDGVEIRFASGEFAAEGPAFAWFRLRAPLVAGEQPTPLQRLAVAGDFGNGISREVSWHSHLFINPDLTLYVERLPVGEWVGLDAQTRLGPDGAGVSDSLLYDEQGRIGRAQQALYVAER